MATLRERYLNDRLRVAHNQLRLFKNYRKFVQSGGFTDADDCYELDEEAWEWAKENTEFKKRTQGVTKKSLKRGK